MRSQALLALFGLALLAFLLGALARIAPTSC